MSLRPGLALLSEGALPPAAAGRARLARIGIDSSSGLVRRGGPIGIRGKRNGGSLGHNCNLGRGFGLSLATWRAALRLRSFFDRRLSQYAASAHQLSNVKVELAAAAATASSYVYACVWPSAAPQTRGELWAMYSDALALTAEGWRIARRSIRASGWHDFPSFDDQPAQFEHRPRRSPV